MNLLPKIYVIPYADCAVSCTLYI